MVHQVEPVGVRRAQQWNKPRRVRLHGRPELRGIQHRGKPIEGRAGRATAVFDPRPPVPRFRRDQHHAVRSVGAVDRRGCGVFEHRDAFDVIRIQEVEGVARTAARAHDGKASTRARAERYAVDHVERFDAGVNRRLTADVDREPASRFVVVDDLEPGDLVLDELLGADDGPGVEIGRVDLGRGAGNVTGALLPIPNNHDL